MIKAERPVAHPSPPPHGPFSLQDGGEGELPVRDSATCHSSFQVVNAECRWIVIEYVERGARENFELRIGPCA